MKPILSWTRPARLFLKDQDGQIAILAAIAAPVAALMAALAIDTGAISTQKREMQGLFDMAAIAAASHLDDPEAAARQVLQDNGFAGVSTGKTGSDVRATGGIDLRVTVGHYAADPSVPHSERFKVNALPHNSARVSMSAPPTRYFDFFGSSRTSLDVTGTAMVSAEVGMSIGSRLVSLDGGLINTLLEDLTGASISLSAMSYDGLLDAEVDLLDCLSWLAEDLDLEAVTFDEVLASNVTLSQLTGAMSETVSGALLAKQALARLSRKPEFASLSVDLGQLFDLGSAGSAPVGGARPAASAAVKALHMLNASAVIANGERQIDLGVAAGLPGLIDLDIGLLVGERPQGSSWFAFSSPESGPVTTAQLRLSIVVTVGGSGILSDSLIRLPVHIELASAEAVITGIDCRPGEAEPRRITVSASPSIARVRIANAEGRGRFSPARIVNGRLLSVRAFADTRAADPEADILRFSRNDIANGPKTAETTDAIRGLLSSAVANLDFSIDVAGLSILSPRLVTAALSDLLESVSEPVDDLVFTTTAALGLGLGEADVWVHNARCSPAVLVQ
jgi:uncharacterized membrane protein